MTSTAGDAHIDTLPPEVLQSVWRHLSFFDLIRCQQVSKSWKACLPGNDPALRRALFSEIAAEDKEDEEDDEDVTGIVKIAFQLKQRVVLRRGHLPRITFILRVYNDPHSFKPFGEDFEHHPIVANLHEYIRLVHPHFKKGSTGRRPFIFQFANFEGLRKLARPVETRGASWEQMRITSPPVQSCELMVSWLTVFEGGEDETCVDSGPMLSNKSGVTVGQFADALREALANAERSIKSFTHEMTDIVGYQAIETD